MADCRRLFLFSSYLWIFFKRFLFKHLTSFSFFGSLKAMFHCRIFELFSPSKEETEVRMSSSHKERGGYESLSDPLQVFLAS